MVQYTSSTSTNVTRGFEVLKSSSSSGFSCRYFIIGFLPVLYQGTRRRTSMRVQEQQGLKDAVQNNYDNDPKAGFFSPVYQ